MDPLLRAEALWGVHFQWLDQLAWDKDLNIGVFGGILHIQAIAIELDTISGFRGPLEASR